MYEQTLQSSNLPGLENSMAHVGDVLGNVMFPTYFSAMQGPGLSFASDSGLLESSP
eukprot:TRINITY_DN6484_c0_g1_i1.p2 TRINITY_DN6484_c0_g1~~TRINITY_DN6484_c0_g1_i1.p2  ORF type:complete len:56 (+),score=8.56 TRINITY_DN6484_c0_g1_i1:427-594(+)